MSDLVMRVVSYRISIAKARRYEGVAAIVGVGHGEFAGRPGQYWVCEAALNELDRHGISYRILSGQRRTRKKVEESSR